MLSKRRLQWLLVDFIVIVGTIFEGFLRKLSGTILAKSCGSQQMLRFTRALRLQMIFLELDELLHFDVCFGLVQVLSEVDLELLHVDLLKGLEE